MRKDTLFSVLSRAPWWISIAAAAVSFAIVRQFLPDIAAIFATLPFIGIAFYAGWRQLRTESASNPDEIIAKMRGMSWENFSALIAEAFRRDGYRVIEIFKGAVDLQVDKKGRVAIVSCKRWKVAQTGIGPLRELLAAKPALDAQDCIYVTTGAFTANARAYATEKNIQLISDAALAELVARVERSKRGWFRR
jgi:restriction system protein